MIANTTQTDEQIIFRQAVFVKSASTQTEGDLLLGRSVSKATQTLENFIGRNLKPHQKLDFLGNASLMSQDGTCDEDDSLRNSESFCLGQDSLSDEARNEEFQEIEAFGFDSISNGACTEIEKMESDFGNEAMEVKYQETDKITTIGKGMKEMKKNDSLKRDTDAGKTVHRNKARRSGSTLTNNIMLQSGVNCQLNLMQLDEKSGPKQSESGCTKSPDEGNISIDHEELNQNRDLAQVSEASQLTMTHFKNITSQSLPDMENKKLFILSDPRVNGLNRNTEETTGETSDIVDGRADNCVSLLSEKKTKTLLMSCMKSLPMNIVKESRDNTPSVQEQIMDIDIQDGQQMTIEHGMLDTDKVSEASKRIQMFIKMDQHNRSHDKAKPYICKYCDKEFKVKVAYQEHELKHIFPPEILLTVPCTVCGKKFQNLSKVKLHHQAVHSVEARRFKCEYCDKIFSLLSNMKTHMRTHTGEKPFKCRFCSKSFSLKCTVLDHENRHQGIKLFPCDVCEMSFVNKSSLGKHKISHSGIKGFQCEVCGDQLSTQTNLNLHMRIHTGEKPYTCHHCGKSFRTRFGLNKHIRIHTGEKLPAKYPCDICGKNFITSYNRKIHRMNHTGDKPFICEMCGKKFQTQGFLNTHLKKCLEKFDREYDNSMTDIQNY